MAEIQNTLSITPWIGLFGVFIGSLVSLASVWLNNKSQQKRLKSQIEIERENSLRDFKRKNLEELYIIVRHWGNAYNGTSFALCGVMQGKVDYNQFLDMTMTQMNDFKHDFNKIEMLVHVYAPELEIRYNEIIDARSKMNAIQIEHKFAYEEDIYSSQRFLNPYVAEQVNFEKAIGLFLEDLIKTLKLAQ